MNWSWRNTLIGTAVVGTTAAITTYFMGLKRTIVQLESFASINIFKLNLKGVTVRVDVQLKNPTRTKFKIKYPFVKLIYKDTTVGTSQVVNQDIEIPAYGEAVAEKIMIQIPVRSIFSVVFGMVKSLLQGETIKITSVTISTIDLGWKKLPYEKTEQLTLKK